MTTKGESKIQPKDPKGLLEIFWKNGGSLILFVDSSPFTCEVNLFLKKLLFLMDIRRILK